MKNGTGQVFLQTNKHKSVEQEILYYKMNFYKNWSEMWYIFNE